MNGAGDIRYKGGASVDSHINGLGKRVESGLSYQL